MTHMTTSSAARAALLETFENLSRTHAEHEKYYGEAPLLDAAQLQRTARALKALADRWELHVPAQPAASPFAGARDLNDERAIEGAGILFMESGERPAEVDRILAEIEAWAAGAERTGDWLGSAMNASWEVAAVLIEIPQLADLLSDRHRIIAADAQSAAMLTILAKQLRRAVQIINHLDLSVAGLRAELAAESRTPAYLYAAAELIDQAADLMVRSAVLVHENEPRWRAFHARVAELRAAMASASED